MYIQSHLIEDPRLHYTGAAGPVIDPVVVIQRLPSLLNLHLVLCNPQKQELWQLPIAQHAIHAIDSTTVPNLKLRVMSLVSKTREERIYKQEMTLEEISAEFAPDNLDEAYIDVIPRTEALAELRKRDIEIEEVLYDMGRHYPVNANGECPGQPVCGRIWMNTVNCCHHVDVWTGIRVR